MTTTRQATKEDIDVLVSLLKELFEQEVEFVFEKQVQYRAIERLLNSPHFGDIFVSENKQKVVGMVVLLYTFSTALGEVVALLEDMIITKEYRNNGFGDKLLNHTLKIAKAKGIKRVTLLSDKDNEKAHKFYHKNGFFSSTMMPFRQML